MNINTDFNSFNFSVYYWHWLALIFYLNLGLNLFTKVYVTSFRSKYNPSLHSLNYTVFTNFIKLIAWSTTKNVK